MANKNANVVGKLNKSPPVTRSQLNLKSPLSLERKVTKLVEEQNSIKQLILNNNKLNEELTNKLEQEIASLKEIIRVNNMDYKIEMDKLFEANRVLQNEIKLVKDKLQNQLGPKVTIDNSSSKPSCSKNSECKLEPKKDPKKILYSEAVRSKDVTKLKTNNRKNKVLVLADSHGRGCWDLLNKKLNNEFEVSVVFKPNAPLKEVVRLAKSSLNDLDVNDHLIILGGTNDLISNDSNQSPQILKTIEELVPVSNKTNLIINTIPLRHDKPELNRLISKTNSAIHKIVNSQKNKTVKRVKINFINERLNRKNYTNHGLHLNISGKNVLCDRLASLVKDKAPVKLGVKETFLTKWLKNGKQS